MFVIHFMQQHPWWSWLLLDFAGIVWLWWEAKDAPYYGD